MVAVSHFALAAVSLASASRYVRAYTQLNDTAYTALLNPSRGFIEQEDVYLSDSSTYVTASTLEWPASFNSVIQQAMIYLDTHLDGSAITATELTSLDTMFAAYRSAGMKVVVRFAYTTETTGTTDVNVTAMAAQIKQLGPLMTKYADIVFVIQQGFIGAWGEQYYSSNFGNDGTVTDAQWADRNTIAKDLLAIVPSGSFGQMRTPAYKQKLLNSTAVSVTSSNKFTSGVGPQIGHFDDCLFGSTTDEGALSYAYAFGRDTHLKSHLC